MTKIEADIIQSRINYYFTNEHLLHQAFTRSSYSAEYPEVLDNEILEFYGDGILDFYVTKMLFEKFSKIVNNKFVSEKNEGELTKLKSIIVSKESLSRCMLNSNFSMFLYLGKSDEQNDVRKSLSVNEDLFEAIIGAVAVDSNWNYEVLEKLCKTMLQMETVNDYLIILIKEKSKALGFGEPCYHPLNFQCRNLDDLMPLNFFNSGYLGINEFCTSKNSETGKHEYEVVIGEKVFKGLEDGPNQAKNDAEKQAYHFLCQEEIRRNYLNIDYENPVSTLHELFQKKIIHEVRYEFNEYHDENGNPIWNCKAFLEGYDIFESDNASKKQVKQNVSLKLLRFITDNVIQSFNK